MSEEKKTCKYPGCLYYDKEAKYYCCDACSADHYDKLELDGTVERARTNIAKLPFV